MVRAFKSKGTDPAKLAEAMVAYKAGDNFSIPRCHGFMMRPPVRQHLELPEFNAVDCDWFPRPGDGLRDTFPVLAGIVDGDEIHHGCHAEVDMYGGTQTGRREEIRVNFNPLNEAILECYNLITEAPAL